MSCATSAARGIHIAFALLQGKRTPFDGTLSSLSLLGSGPRRPIEDALTRRTSSCGAPLSMLVYATTRLHVIQALHCNIVIRSRKGKTKRDSCVGVMKTHVFPLSVVRSPTMTVPTMHAAESSIPTHCLN